MSRRPRGAPALWRGRGTARRKDGHPSTRPHVHQSTSPAATPRPFSTPWPVRGCPAQRPPPSWCGKVCLGDPSERLTVNNGPGRTAAKRSGSSWPKEYTRAYPHTRSDTHTHKHHTHTPDTTKKKRAGQCKQARSGCQTKIREDHRRSHTREKSRRGSIAQKKRDGARVTHTAGARHTPPPAPPHPPSPR